MTRDVAANESVTVPNGEFWRGSIYGGVFIASGTSTSNPQGITLTAGTTLKATTGGCVISVLRFSEV